MSEYIVQSETLTNIADAIREKTGMVDTMTTAEMPELISAISTGFPNGTEWTASNITSGYFKSITNANGVWIACSGSDSGGVYYSTDGMTWTQSNITSGSTDAIAYANGMWVATMNNAGVYYSTDGMEWVKSSSFTRGRFTRIVNANGVWIFGNFAPASTVLGIYYSTDGMTWTKCYKYPYIECITYANGIWVAGHSHTNGSRGLLYSVAWQPS